MEDRVSELVEDGDDEGEDFDDGDDDVVVVVKREEIRTSRGAITLRCMDLKTRNYETLIFWPDVI